jgi:hypothetical protein
MQKFVRLSLAAGVSALAVGWAELRTANAADMSAPQEQAQAPSPGYYGYGPPPVEPGYDYPQPAYGYPPPPVAYYGYPAPPIVVLPEAYYERGPYWGPYYGGYGPRFARGYGHWDRGYRHR